MKKRLTLLFFFIIVCCGFAQSKTIDSLKSQLMLNQKDSMKANTLAELSYYYLYNNIDSSLFYGKKLEKYARELDLTKFKLLANKNIGNAYIFSSMYDSAEVYLKKAISIADKNLISKSALYTSLGVMYKRQNNYEKALEAYFEGVRDDELSGNEYGEFVKLMNIANLYGVMGNYESSIKYNKRALSLSKKAKNNKINFALGTLLNNIGINYAETNRFDYAIDYFKQSLQINLKNENKKEIARNYNNLGVMYERKGNLNESLIYLNKSLEVLEQQQDENDVVKTHMSLGTTYGKISNKIKSDYHFDKALELAKKLKSSPLISETYLAISDVNLLKNRPEKALENYKFHIQFKDSILNDTNEEILNEIETKYQTEKKDKELTEQKLAIEKSELELQKKKTQYSYMTGAVLILLIGSILLWFLHQQRQKRKDQEILTLKREQQVQTLESLMEGEEKERMRIAKELHDGVNVDLSAIKYKLTSLLEKNNEVINEAVAMIDKSCEQVRAISHNLIPPSLKDFSLIETVEDFCTTTNSLHKPEVSFQHIGEAIQISKKAEINIFRIVQELVNNSVKHASASEIDVQISHRDTNVQLTVEDNGKGFDKENVGGTGIGLKNVQSRVDYLHAKLDFHSNEKGTSYIIDINTEDLI